MQAFGMALNARRQNRSLKARKSFPPLSDPSTMTPNSYLRLSYLCIKIFSWVSGVFTVLFSLVSLYLAKMGSWQVGTEGAGRRVIRASRRDSPIPMETTQGVSHPHWQNDPLISEK